MTEPDDFVPMSDGALESSIVACFQAQVAAWPERPAVHTPGEAVTYRELARRADRIARALVGELGGGGEAVAILLPQGTDLVAAILGTLTAGRPYVGLDSAYPPALLAEMVSDSGARVVLGGEDRADLGWVQGSGADLWSLDDLPTPPPALALPRIGPETPAYIFYTSGSTGRPKGVVDAHRNVLHNILRYTNTLRIAPSDRMSLVQSAAFSGSVSSLFGALLNGACSCPIDLHDTTPARLARWLVEERITIYHSVPAVFRGAFGEGRSFPDLRVVRLEGDQAAKADVETFSARVGPHAVLVNGLGTTETGLVRQFFASPHDRVDGAVLPVGYPVRDMEVTVVGDDGAPLPVGTVGEVAVTSRYLATGYWRDPRRTAERFRPVAGEAGLRTYRTGDLGRMRPDGCLEHLGRVGGRVKVRGHTVELADAEAALLALPGVAACAFASEERTGGGGRLVAYWVRAADGAGGAAELRAALAERVPPHFVPSRFVELDALPLTVHGKVDRSALQPSEGGERPIPSTPVEPRNLLERQLAALWEEVLDVSPVGVADDFLDLGGDSLAALTLLARLESDLGVEPSMKWILTASTVADLADRVMAERPARDRALDVIQEGGGGAPMVYVHGDYLSGGYYCLRLARAMGPQVPFVTVAPSGFDEAEPASSYEEIARSHLRAIRAHQPHGPYHLGGTCNGGLVAYEVARLLVEAGEEVRTLALFAASARNVRLRALHRACRLVDLLGRGRGRALFGWFVRAGRRVEDGVRERGPIGFLARVARVVTSPRQFVPRLVGPPPEAGPERWALREHYLRLDDEYVPGPYPGTVTLLWPSDEPEPAAEARSHWSEVAGDVRLLELPVGHQACLTTEVSVLGRALVGLWEAGGGAG